MSEPQERATAGAPARTPSPWLEEAPEGAPAPPLAGERRVEVAVVGAGLTGLGTALALREEGRSVALLEAEHAGHGASGRNAGHLTPTIGKDLPSLLRLYGRERAGRFAACAEAAVAHVERWIERFGIDCDYRATGNVIAAVHEGQHARLERAARAAETLGLRATWLAPEAMRKRDLPEAFTAGVLEGAGGTLHPGRYVRGLRAAALAAGAELYEGTPVVGIEEGPSVRLRTPRGAVRADRVVVAANAWVPRLGVPRRRVLRATVSLVRSAPLSGPERRAVGWSGGEGIYTAHEILESWRIAADGRVVGGSKVLRYAMGDGDVPEDDPATRATLERAFRERFPELGGVAIERFWSGPIALTLDFLPAWGVAGRYRNLFYAAGYGGHGLALASYAGPALVDWWEGREGPGRALLEHRTLPLPPEPLRWLAVRGIAGALGRADARADRRARGRRSQA